MMQPMETLNHSETPDKDLPLRYDIRLLGRILGDTVRAQEGEAGVRAGRAHPAHRSPVPPRRRRGRPAGAAGDHERPADRPGAAASSGPSAISRTSPTSPRTSTTSAAPAPTPWPRRRRGAGTMAYALDRARSAGISRGATAGVLRPRSLQPGPDGASDRGPAQELDRPRDGDRPAARRARPHRVHAGGAGGQPQGAAPRRAHSVADQHPARHAPQGHRRGRQRSCLLRPHLPARAAGLLRRPRGSASAPPTRPGRTSRCRPSCAWAAGSAATATAIPTSPPT